MNYKEMVQSVYSQAYHFRRFGENQILIFDNGWHEIACGETQDEAWEHAWYYVQKQMLRKLEG